MCWRPLRQFRQCPQAMWPSPVTRSPSLTLCTSEPVAATCPTYSSPIIMGVLMVFCAQSSHLYMCRSVPQMEVLLILMSTSLCPGWGRGTSCIQMPFSARAFTSARMLAIAEILVVGCFTNLSKVAGFLHKIEFLTVFLRKRHGSYELFCA